MTIRIAIIEDDLFLLETLARTIAAEEDFTLVFQATTAEEGLEYEHWHNVDVLLLDVNLPGASGIELTSILAALHPHLSILIHTVHEDRNTVYAAFHTGAAGYILKGDTDPGVCQSIRNLMNGQPPISKAVARWLTESQSAHNQWESHMGSDLSIGEVEVLQLMARGEVFNEIADTLGISIPTVYTRLNSIYTKLRTNGRKEAIKRARMLGYIGT